MIVGLDIGTSKVCAVAGQVDTDGQVRIVAKSEHPSEGVRSGSVVNIETVLKTIGKVIEDVELTAGCEIKQVVTGLSGSHIEGLLSQGVVGIKSKDHEVHPEDIYRSMEVARAFELPLDREILHTLIQDFRIDGRSGIKDPLDMIGHRLEAQVMIVTGSVASSANIEKCITRSGYAVKRRVLQQLADSQALMSDEEKQMGTLLLDLGAGMSNMIGYVHGSPVCVGGIDLGGNQITNDLAYVLNQPFHLVEEVKKRYGSCYEPSVDASELITIPQAGGLPAIRMPRRELAKIIEPRAAETLAMLRSILEKKRLLHAFGGGILLTGGGAMMPGMTELSSEIFDIPTRRARYRHVAGFTATDDLRFSTALGLVLYDAQRQNVTEAKSTAGKKSRENPKGFGSRLKHVFDVLF